MAHFPRLGAAVSPKLQLAALVGQVGYHVTKEKLTRPRPTTLREVPPSPEALTPRWLTQALCDGTPNAAVLGYELGPRNDGTSARRTMRVTYNEAGRAAGLPEALFTKSGPTFLNRMVGAGAGLARVESSFYSQVRPLLDIEAPTTLYSAYDPVSHRQLLITDDVTQTRGASFGDARNRVLTSGQTEQIIDTLAALHARFWNAPLRRRYGSWLQNAHEVTETLNVTIGAAARILSGFERAREVIPPEVYARRTEVHPALMRSQQINVTTGPQTFLHGDVHPGNWYVTGGGQMGLYDWQLSVQGGPARDLAYALSTHLPIEQRRASERGLLERYLDQLAQAGVITDLTLDQLFLAYRQQLCYPMLAWLATIGRSPLQPKYQPDDVSLANLARITQAFADHNTLDAVNN
ncbi:MAG TPA: phosphotransferase [Pseudonocardia sp.]|jgi:thiamine kinase-like enzyme